MDKYFDVIDESLTRYFTSVKEYGYVKDRDICKLILLLFIDEILNGYFEFPLEEEEYSLLQNTLLCLEGSNCLIPYKEYINNMDDMLVTPWIATKWGRTSEDNVLRVTQLDNLRGIENNSILSD